MTQTHYLRHLEVDRMQLVSFDAFNIPLSGVTNMLLISVSFKFQFMILSVTLILKTILSWFQKTWGISSSVLRHFPAVLWKQFFNLSSSRRGCCFEDCQKVLIYFGLLEKSIFVIIALLLLLQWCDVQTGRHFEVNRYNNEEYRRLVNQTSASVII